MTTSSSPRPAPRPAARSVSGLVLAVAGLVVLAALGVGLVVWLRAQSATASAAQVQIAQAVEVYAQAGDLAQAQPWLPSMTPERLARLFAQAEAAAPDEAARWRVRALQTALNLPTVTLTLWDTLFSQNLIVLSLALAAVPLVAALVINLLPWLPTRRPPTALGGRGGLKAEAPAGMSAEPEPEAAPSLPEAPAPTPAEPRPPAAPAPTVEPQMQDILSSVFESEGVTIRYETLLGVLDDIPAAELLETSQQVAQQLQAPSASAEDQEG